MAFEMSRSTRFWGFVAGTTGTAATVSSPIIDMAGFDGIYAAGYIEVTATATTLKLLVCTASAGTYACCSGTVEGSQPGLVGDWYRPRARFAKVHLNTTGGAANAVLGVWTYKAKSQPTTYTTNIVVGRFYSPDTGTAT